VLNALLTEAFKVFLPSGSVNCLNISAASCFSCEETGISAPPSTKTLAVAVTTLTFPSMLTRVREPYYILGS
jgi:hypothetical protein